MARITLHQLQAMKAKAEKIAMLTAYDASFGALLEKAGIEVILVGDSLGTVLHGAEHTLSVTMTEMIYHTKQVVYGNQTAWVIADLPFMSYSKPEKALDNAAALLAKGGAQMVKLEGGTGILDTVDQLVRCGIPVCGHLGLLPQSVHRFGYRVQGRDGKAAKEIMRQAEQLEQAGASMLVLECVPATLAADITATLSIPVIGIGAGGACDGQVLVLYDMLGITPGKQLRFSHNFLQDTDSVLDAVKAYRQAVKTGHFPAEKHQY